MTDYLKWAQAQQPQPSYLNALSGFSTPTDYSTTQAPQMFGGTNTTPMDWTQGALGNLGTGGFTGAGLVPQESFMNRLGSSDFWLGGIDKATGNRTMGAAAPLMQGAGALMSGFMGMKQYGMSKKVFENNKQQFERNFDAQKGVTNSQLSDRQDRRNADARANGMTDTQSTADYMAKWGVK